MSESVAARAPFTHFCHLYNDLAERKALILPLFKAALDAGECCVLAVSESKEHEIDDWYLEIQATGIDVRAMRESGALLVTSRGDSRLSQMSPVARAREAWGFFEEKLRHFGAVHVIGDVDWAVTPALDIEDLCYWEATFDLLVDGAKVRAICQYDLASHTAPALHTALKTHAKVMLDGATFANPYYEASRILDEEPARNGSDADAFSIASMLDAIRSAAKV